jgi:hypothetical protein
MDIGHHGQVVDRRSSVRSYYRLGYRQAKHRLRTEFIIQRRTDWMSEAKHLLHVEAQILDGARKAKSSERIRNQYSVRGNDRSYCNLRASSLLSHSSPSTSPSFSSSASAASSSSSHIQFILYPKSDQHNTIIVSIDRLFPYRRHRHEQRYARHRLGGCPSP